MSELIYRAAARTDVGRAREQNEDAVYAGRHVFAVADGLGGHSAGEVASTLALRSIMSLDEMDARRAAGKVADAVRKANRAVFDRSLTDAGLKGMGTTMTALAVADGTAHIGHVGDSRAYLIRAQQITQLSTDHTLVNRMVAEGKITAEQAESHPQRSILTRALGNEREVEIQEASVQLAPGDRILLCSDGLTGVLGDEEIRALVSHGADLGEICDALVDEANARGGPDNITVVVVDVSGTGPPAPAPKSARATDGRRRRIPVRALVWVAAVAVVVGGGFLFVRGWADRSWYVGIDGKRVAIYQGLPVSFAGVDLSEVQEPTTIETASLPPGMRARLADGIRASSLVDARRIVEDQIRPNSSTLPPRPLPTIPATPTGSPSP